MINKKIRKYILNRTAKDNFRLVECNKCKNLLYVDLWSFTNKKEHYHEACMEGYQNARTNLFRV